MSDIIERAESVLQDVSPGPWRVIGYGNVSRGTLHETRRIGKLIPQADAIFAAESRQLIPELIAEVKRLRWQSLHGGDHMCEECWPLEDDDDQVS